MPDQANTPPNNEEGQQNTFVPPATQDDLDRIISSRIVKERAKFADYANLKAKAAKYEEAENAKKSEVEKLQGEISEYKSKLTAYEQAQKIAGWKQEVSKTNGIPAAVLSGNTLEELETHAAIVKEAFKTKEGDNTPPATAPIVPGLGKGQGDVPKGTGTQQLAEEISNLL